MTDNENVKQHARRLAKEYAGEHLAEWDAHDKKWMQYAFTKGYKAACEDIAEDIDDLGLDIIEINDVLDYYDADEQVAA
jgi:hypothetical protein